MKSKKNAPKELKHVTMEIVQDTNAGNPRDEFDNLATFYGPKNSNYIIGGKDDFALGYNLDETIAELRKAGAVIVEFQANAGTCYAVVERTQIKDEYLTHGYSMRKGLAAARRCAEGEIETWKNWCDGEVYGYIVKDLDGNHLDSCWGFYGEEFAREEGQAMAEHHDAELAKSEKQIEDRLEAVTK